MNEELDSQLSAMFDNELPAAECELLARRLSRDDELKARWSRYAAISATIRAEGGARLNIGVARRVSDAISAEPVTPAAAQGAGRDSNAWWRPLGGLAVAASVAAAAIVWVRYQSPVPTAVVAPTAPAAVSVAATDSYVVPRPAARRSIVPSTQLANYVVAHSEFSSPVNRRNILSALMVTESGSAGTASAPEDAPEDVSDDGKNP